MIERRLKKLGKRRNAIKISSKELKEIQEHLDQHLTQNKS